MSNDPFLNSALFNFCNKLDNGPRSNVPRDPRSLEDLAWLRQALAAIESPDKVLKQHLQVIEIAMGWNSLGGGKPEVVPALPSPPSSASDNKGPEPTGLKKLATGVTPVTVDDVLASLDYLTEELEDINMATEFCLMNGPSILLNLLQVSAANFVPSATPIVAITTTTTEEVSAVPVTESPAAAEDTPAATSDCTAMTVVPPAKQQKKEDSVNVLKEPFLAGLKHNNEVRSAAAMAIAHAVQQNPKAQEAFSVCRWADIVMPLITYEIADFIHATAKKAVPAPGGTVTNATVAALLHICSCMSRENDEGTKEFVVRGGITLLDMIISNPARVSTKIIRRALFFVEYLATIGISNKQLIEHTANVLLLTGTQQTLRTPSSSSAVADPIGSSVLIADAEAKNDVQRVAAAALLSICEKGGNTVKDILKPMGVGKYLEKALPLAHVAREDVRWVLAKTLEG